MQRLWVTGYRSYEINAFGDKDPKIAVVKFALQNAFQRYLDDGQLDWVLTGGNLGVEQWAAQTAVKMEEIRTAIMVPYANFASHWNEAHQEQFAQLTQVVDFFAATSNEAYAGPWQFHNYEQFMLAHTDRALLVYDPEHPGKIKYEYELLKQKNAQGNYPLEVIDFYDLQEQAEEYQELERERHDQA